MIERMKWQRKIRTNFSVRNQLSHCDRSVLCMMYQPFSLTIKINKNEEKDDKK